MKSQWILWVAVFACLVCEVSGAEASTKFKNNTPNPVWVAYAHSADQGAGCGYNDGCGGATHLSGSYKVQGWWQIAPGGTVTVNGHAHHNARHQYYAEDGLGHVWQGGGFVFATNWEAFTRCGNSFPFGSINRTFRQLSNSTCCGFWCSPVNYTLTLVL